MAVAVGVRIRFLARLREHAGVEAEEFKAPAQATVADVYDALRGRHSGLPAKDGVRAAVNYEFVAWDVTVSEGDEIAFIPPVSGGCCIAL